jgi:drug/metabolite transporter (DMT)-like permease
MTMWEILIVILIGIADTVQLHLAKSMQRQGIEIFDQIRAKIKKEHLEIEGKVKKPVIYLVGLVLNNIEPIWLIVANLFGVYPALVTSMFGVGLVVLMVYSVKVLHEPVNRREATGAVVIIGGTLVLGVEAFFRPEYDEAGISTGASYLFAAAFTAVAVAIIIIASRTRNARTMGFAFGIAAGGFGGQDIIFKMLGQNDMNSIVGWLVFASSFIIAFFAFFFTQLGFARKAPASVLVPAYDATYVLVPILFQALLLPGFQIWPSTVLGAATVVAGIALMRGLTKKEK